MKFHNGPVGVYRARMNLAAPRTMLARLRSSARLAMFVLLIFALKIGAAAACAKHDFADLGFGTDSSHGVTVEAPAADGPDGLTKGTLAHAGACSHCSCHHPTAMVPDTHGAFAYLAPQGVAVRVSGLPPSAQSRLELRPPIV